MERNDRIYNIIPMSSQSFTFLVILCLAILAIFAIPQFTEDFSWQGTLISAIICIGLAFFILSFGYQCKKAVFSLTSRALTIKPGIYGRTIPKEEIDIAGVRVIDLNYERGYQPRWWKNGAGLPGYSTGWFKLQNGEKVLMFVTDRSNVVYIPTRKNYSVLLSVQQADEMVRQMRKWD
jgi:hypothetical protein